jgi:phosphoribosylformimino-5-aminoimidazole carboxamide ribotide isomerase
MQFEVIPAIDLRGGQAVRLQKGDFGTTEKVAENPVDVARSFEAQGATRIHVVDLDASRTGVPHEAETIAAIIGAVSVPVQIGGGIRSLEIIERLLLLGADRLIVGTSAARDAELTARMLEKYAQSIIIGADTAEGYIAVQGWQEKTGETAEAFGKRLVGLGAERFLFTDIARDGMLQGPNIEATSAFARAVGVPVIASGGVSGIHDIKNLVRAQPDGIEGVITGKAIYAGRLNLAEAFAVARGESAQGNS